MKEGQKLWSREELILAMNLYCKLPFGRLHSGTPEIIKLSELIGRTANSVAYKLVNLASLDPSLHARGIKGAANASKLDKEIWNEFYLHWDILPYESEKLLAKFKHTTVEILNDIVGYLDGSLNFPYIFYSSFVLSPMGKDYKTEANY